MHNIGAINEGKGTVLQNKTILAQLEELFTESPTWTNQELNDALGWQFGQAIFYLRRKLRKENKFIIVTKPAGGRVFTYTMMPSGI